MIGNGVDISLILHEILGPLVLDWAPNHIVLGAQPAPEKKVSQYLSGLQIYGGPGSLSHDFKIWPITFQGSGPSGPS